MGYETELSFNEGSSTLSLPIRLRERHLTEDTKDVAVQAIGRSLQVTLWSERDNITIRIPLSEWHTDQQRSRRLSGANDGLISLGRYEQYLDYDEDGAITATVLTHDYDEP